MFFHIYAATKRLRPFVFFLRFCFASFRYSFFSLSLSFGVNTFECSYHTMNRFPSVWNSYEKILERTSKISGKNGKPEERGERQREQKKTQHTYACTFNLPSKVGRMGCVNSKVRTVERPKRVTQILRLPFSSSHTYKQHIRRTHSICWYTQPIVCSTCGCTYMCVWLVVVAGV